MDQLWVKVIALDLKSVQEKFAARKSWWWKLWRSSQQIESQYRQFLFLMAHHPDKTVVPWSEDLDDFWRLHSLNTTKYAADCNSIAGRSIPYKPSLFRRSRGQATECEETRKLYLASFGESARKRRRDQGESWPGEDNVQVYSDSGGHARTGHHAHHSWGHAGGHHSAGTPAHGGHSGHSCGGHSGGHGCGGHGCGGHGCGGH